MPSPKATAAVLDRRAGRAADRGGTWIEMSTNGPEEIRRFAALAAEHGIATLEAPVTGGVHRAAAGEITVLVGGDEALFRAHEPALRAMGGEIIHMGPLGSAAVIKVITNMLAFVHLVASGEAMMLAKRGGLDLAKAYAAIRASSGNSFVHETETQLILSGSYDIGFTMDLACKDLGFALAMGRETRRAAGAGGPGRADLHPRPAAAGRRRVVDGGGAAARGRAGRGAAGPRLSDTVDLSRRSLEAAARRYRRRSR